MKLYCVRFRDGDSVIDVQHIAANNSKEVRNRLDKTIERCQFHDIKEYNGYSFFEVCEIDDFVIKLEKTEGLTSII